MASSSPPPPNPTSLSDELPPQPLPAQNYKNKLIEFTQRANIAMPEFRSHNEGPSHAPEFRASVLVDELVFTLQTTFFHRKAAEQEVSRSALEFLVNKIKEEGRSIISKSVTFCKSTVNEYAMKLNIKPPTYNTVEYKKVFPYFVSTMDFNCTSYIGDAARRKKDAEDLAARAAILSIIDKSDSGIMLVQMIKAKAKLFDSVQSKTLPPTCDNVIVSPIEKTEFSCELNQGLNDKDKGVADPVTLPPTCDNVIVSPIEKTEFSCELNQGLNDKDKGVADPVGNNNINEVETVRSQSVPVISSHQQPEMSAHEQTPEAAKSSNDSLQPVNALPTDNVVNAKKRRRNNYKANKKARLEAQLKALSCNQVPSSVSQDLSSNQVPPSVAE